MDDTQQMIERLKELNALIPASLRWDWEGTSHYELTDPEGESYFWLCFFDFACWVLENRNNYIPGTEEGQRLGAIIEYGVIARKLFPMLLDSKEDVTL